jgi:4-alpha-glucanotransferase
MNRPGEVEGNWSWQLEPGQLAAEHADRLRDVATAGARLPE